MKIFITGNSALIRCVFLENNKIEYFFIEKNPSDIFVGNIYKGRIENILKGLNAAFVNIGEPTNGFIHFDQKEMYFYNEGEEQIPLETNIHKVGEEILVQVTKPGKELKGMKLTT
ncbi:S1 RNA-binding domain-containing protein, partial [bacterium]|nr:S1 RNA-binding domain-containing protein [bacterium]